MSGKAVKALACVVVLALVAPASAPASIAGTEVFLPSVGSAPGVAPSVWYTTVWVFNPNGTVVSVEFSFLRRDQDNSSPADTYSVDVQPGAVLQIDDAVTTMFGIQGFGALRAVSDQEVHIVARIYSKEAGEAERESVGQFFAAVPAALAIGAGGATDLIGLTNLEGGDFRYNVGFVETTGNQLNLQLTLHTTGGNSWVTTAVTLRPYEQKQMSVDTLFNNAIGESDNFRLHVTGGLGSGKAIVFGSRVANGSQDPTTFEMSYPALP